MFGDVAFAQAPFAALGGATVLSSVSEAASAAASVSQETRAGSLVQESVSTSATFVSTGNIFVASRSETATATASTNFAASTFVATQAESATGTDAYSTAGSNYLVTVAESATGTDEPSAIADLLAAIAEISTASDSVNGGRVYEMTVTETAAGTATQTVATTFVGTVAELVSGLDAYSNTKTVNARPDGIQLTVSIGQALVWGTIPTGQTPPAPDWTDIPT